ncbi:MAG: DUF2461 domain-containing protein [Sediminibacterium sp.]
MRTSIPASSFQFLKELKKHNNREWFTQHKERYQTELQKIEFFAEELLKRMKQHDRIDTMSGKKALHRIYRDIRFSSDKTPYKTNWSGGFHRGGAQLRGGYYFRFQPGGQSLIAGGFWGPNPRDLKLIRDEFAFDDKPIRAILSLPEIKSFFRGLSGEKLKTVPRGYDPRHNAADLLGYKQFILERKFTDNEVLSKDFIDNAVSTMRALQPFFDYMSHALYVPD